MGDCNFGWHPIAFLPLLPHSVRQKPFLPWQFQACVPKMNEPPRDLVSLLLFLKSGRVPWIYLTTLHCPENRIRVTTFCLLSFPASIGRAPAHSLPASCHSGISTNYHNHECITYHIVLYKNRVYSVNRQIICRKYSVNTGIIHRIFNVLSQKGWPF